MTVLNNPEKENPRADAGYSGVPEWRNVKWSRVKRAPEPSPLLQEYMKKQAERRLEQSQATSGLPNTRSPHLGSNLFDSEASANKT